MAVAHDAASESHTGITGSTSEGSFSWTHTPVGTPRGVLVFVISHGGSGADIVSAVTYGGSALSIPTGAVAVDTTGEDGRTQAWFLGSSIPTGAQTVQVTRTNNASVVWACAITVTASGDTEVHTAGIVLLQEDGTLAEQNVTDGSPGTNSLRYAGLMSGLGNVPTPGANSTALHDLDVGARVNAVVRETTAGQGSRPVGWASASSDDRAAVHLAIRETGGGGGPTGNPWFYYAQQG